LIEVFLTQIRMACI